MGGYPMAELPNLRWVVMVMTKTTGGDEKDTNMVPLYHYHNFMTLGKAVNHFLTDLTG
jgi:hypothetical protein